VIPLDAARKIRSAIFAFVAGVRVSGMNLIDSRVENGSHHPHQFWLKLKW
jgi:hypothetical protein